MQAATGMSSVIDNADNIAHQLACFAARGDWVSAIEFSQHHFVSEGVGPGLFLKAAAELCNAQMIDLAEVYLLEGRRRWPNDIWLSRSHAELVSKYRNFDAAAAHWQELMERHPDSPLGLCGFADLHRRFGREEDAARLFSEAATRFSDFVWALDGNACTQTQSHSWAEAARLWEDVRERFPKHLRAHEELVRALIEDGNLAKAEEAARFGLAVFPQAEKLSELYARIGRVHSKFEQPSQQFATKVSDLTYRCPTDLAVSSAALRRVMIIGSCQVGQMPPHFEKASPGVCIDLLLFNNLSVLPKCPPHPPAEYDFQFLQIALRNVLPYGKYFRLPYSNVEAYTQLFDETCDRMIRMLYEMMSWNREHGIPSFVCSFLAAQQNPMGRLLPRYDLRNFVYFVEKLNEALARELNSYNNAYLIDLNQIVGTYGRRDLQDDAVWSSSHAWALVDFDFAHDRKRLDAIKPIGAYYPTKVHDFVLHLWAEILAMHRSIRQIDMVKLVLVDLDDTLWRGVAAEESDRSEREGWPVGFAEALLFLKQRGVLLGIVSKNDESRVTALWHQIYDGLIRPEDFAVRKINWRPKADNIEEILADVNLLPRNVVFIDDNPVERASVKAAFPDMRVLGANPYLWRRILLWSAETQVPYITSESTARTEMVQAQVQRETQRKQMSREDFLASLGVCASLTELRCSSDPQFPRVFELINKTNQFNTSGRRWTMQEFTALFAEGGRICALNVTDKYTSYGVVGALVINGSEILQFVMSCRVVGMDIELASVSAVVRTMVQDGYTRVLASLIETPSNLLCRDLWQRCGFIQTEPGRFVHNHTDALAIQPHITMTISSAICAMDPVVQPRR